MFLKKRDVERALTQKLGCEVDERGRKHKFFLFSLDGQIVARTHTSHGGDEDLGENLLKAMGEQLRVTKRFFIEMVNCTKSRAEYEAELRGPTPER